MQKDCHSNKEKGTSFSPPCKILFEMECVKEDVKEGKGFIVRDATDFMMM